MALCQLRSYRPPPSAVSYGAMTGWGLMIFFWRKEKEEKKEKEEEEKEEIGECHFSGLFQLPRR